MNETKLRWPCGCQYVGHRRVVFCRLHGFEDYLRYKHYMQDHDGCDIFAPGVCGHVLEESGQYGGI